MAASNGLKRRELSYSAFPKIYPAADLRDAHVGCHELLTQPYMMPEDGLDRLRDNDAIFLGAVGYPGVPDHVSLWGLLIPIRRTFQQYVNLRPVRLLEGVSSPLKSPGNVDFYIVRENNEGEYSSSGGRIYQGTKNEVVVQESIFTRNGVDKVMKYAFELANKRGKRLTSATKSNGIIHTMPFWDERFADIGKAYPNIETSQYHIDILAYIGNNYLMNQLLYYSYYKNYLLICNFY